MREVNTNVDHLMLDGLCRDLRLIGVDAKEVGEELL